jgi:hypothetical protein
VRRSFCSQKDFLVYLFPHWLITRGKNCIVPGERAMSRQGSVVLCDCVVVLFIICYAAAQISALFAIAAVGGWRFGDLFCDTGYAALCRQKLCQSEVWGAEHVGYKQADAP